MSLVFQRTDRTANSSLRRSEFIRGMQCISAYDSPAENNEGRARLLSAEEREDDDDSGSCSSSSIGRNSDDSDGSSSDGEDSPEAEAQSELKGPLDTIDALEEVLPMRRGISRFYSGKSKSFTCLADAAAASSIKDFAKPDNPYNKKRKNLLAHGLLFDKNRNHPLRSSGSEISKRVANSCRSTLALETTVGSPDSDSMAPSSSTCRPPLHPQYKKSTTIGPSSQTTRVNPPCRSFSLSDLQFIVAATPNIAGLAVHSGDKHNKLH